MAKEVSMSFRVDTQLRDAFSEAAEVDRRPASQVLRDFMYRYVQAVRERKESEPGLSAWEKGRRQARMRSALASVELEGYDVPDSFKDAATRYADGDMSLDELRAFNSRLPG